MLGHILINVLLLVESCNTLRTGMENKPSCRPKTHQITSYRVLIYFLFSKIFLRQEGAPSHIKYPDGSSKILPETLHRDVFHILGQSDLNL